jgi:hypothetical protein
MISGQPMSTEHADLSDRPDVLEEVLRQVPRIKTDLMADGYFIWRTDVTRELVQSARDEYIGVMKSLPLHPQSEPFQPASLDVSPWRKLAVGATNGLGYPYAQFLTTTYFPQRSSRLPHLTALFETLVRLRNTLTSLREDFGSDPAADGFWNACRVHHYPRGGGFMSEHRDTHFPSVLQGKGLPFLQLMACLSTIGEDFERGGGFVRDKKRGEVVRTDVPGSFGSIVLFDGSIAHGVDTVDADVLPDFTSPGGRLAAFVNLYKVL